VHRFDPGQQDPGTAKRLETEHGPRASLDRPTILLDYVVELFGLTDLEQAFEHARHGGIQTLLHRSHRSSSPLEHS